MSVLTLPTRPLPPAELLSSEELEFVPAEAQVVAWITRHFVYPTGALYDPRHAHLGDARVGVVWASRSYEKQGRRVLGTAEMPPPGAGDWKKARSLWWLRRWFGEVPDFVITLAADHVAECSDVEFCALIDHELCHCAQAVDEYGMPKFRKSGEPVFCIRGHDVEEFVSVVRRFGVTAAGEAAVEFTLAANQKPEVGRATVSAACGTCTS